MFSPTFSVLIGSGFGLKVLVSNAADKWSEANTVHWPESKLLTMSLLFLIWLSLLSIRFCMRIVKDHVNCVLPGVLLVYALQASLVLLERK